MPSGMTQTACSGSVGPTSFTTILWMTRWKFERSMNEMMGEIPSPSWWTASACPRFWWRMQVCGIQFILYSLGPFLDLRGVSHAIIPFTLGRCLLCSVGFPVGASITGPSVQACLWNGLAEMTDTQIKGPEPKQQWKIYLSVEGQGFWAISCQVFSDFLKLSCFHSEVQFTISLCALWTLLLTSTTS